MFEGYTEDFFLEQARDMGQKLGVDTRQGSVYMDAAAGHSLRAAKFYNDLSTAFNMMAFDTCTGEILDEKAKERQIYRKEATPSYYNATFEGVGAIDMLGNRFLVGGYYFVLAIRDSNYYLMSEVNGSETNYILPGEPVIPMRNTQGLTSAVLGELYLPGTDLEDDESFRKRYQSAVSNPPENGNKQQYKIWCEAYEGIGRAIIKSLAYGPNTVQAILISADGVAPTEALINEIQEDIDPGSEGLGEGKAFVGCKFYAEPAKEIPIDLMFRAELSGGYTLDTALESAKKDLTEYLKDIALNASDKGNMIIQYVKVVAILADTPGISDFTDLTINGGTGNINIKEGGVGVLGEVSVDVSI